MKKLSKISAFAALVLLMTTASCKKSSNGTSVEPPPDAVVVPDGFNYENSKTIQLDIKLLSTDGTPLKNTALNIYDTYTDDGSRKLATFVSDANGNVSHSLEVPSYVESIVADPVYVGIIHELKFPVTGGNVTGTLGGINGYEGNAILDHNLKTSGTQIKGASLLGATYTYNYLGSYDGSGVPKYLTTNEVIDSKLLSYINASLPEYQPVPSYHPEFLNPTAQTNLDIVEKSEVWITFVTEGAGYQNSLAYYTYPTGSDPKTNDQIKALNIILPNASLSGSGGGLKAGNRVKIGVFEPGTSIGFALIANGWNGSSVGNGYNVFFADDALNPEANSALKRHTVLLYDDERKLFLTGFEDQKRDAGSDNDFNDLVFYSKSNPITAISTDNVNPIDKPVDSDGDGVNDTYDKFPKDATRAYISYFPSENLYGTLAFEDLWPGTGDYDMNDLVVNYRYTLIKNAANKTVDMYANYAVSAIGAAFINGFGVQFPFAPSAVKSVTGDRITGNIAVKKLANGLEAGQDKAVIIPFDNAYKLVNKTGGFVNTVSGTPIVNSDTVSMYISFNSPVDATTLGSYPFNPFLIVNGDRGREVHLPGMKPTALANTKLFNTSADNTLPASNKYYKTKDNLPFAISFVETFENPIEKSNIKDAYLKYTDWVKTGGSTFSDWYKNKSNGFRNDPKIYKK